MYPSSHPVTAGIGSGLFQRIRLPPCSCEQTLVPKRQVAVPRRSHTRPGMCFLSWLTLLIFCDSKHGVIVFLTSQFFILQNNFWSLEQLTDTVLVLPCRLSEPLLHLLQVLVRIQLTVGLQWFLTVELVYRWCNMDDRRAAACN